jgi:quercetin dioxygenase-like cupin family protein/ribosomal protein S18 acetylase RimI-like enzyme
MDTREGEEAFCFIDPEQAPKMMQMEGLETTILTGLHGEQMMMALNATLPGHTVPLHSHPHEQVGMVYRGKARLIIGDEERIAKKGDFYCIPAHVPHSDTTIGDEPFIMLDVFYPVREDFIARIQRPSTEREEPVSEVGIRAAQADDAWALHEVMKRAFNGLRGRRYSEKAIDAAIMTAQEIRDRISHKGTHVLVATLGEQIVGTASGIEEHESLHVCSMAVDPSYQGQGVAHRLMKELEILAQQSGCRKLFLQTGWAMTEAIALYRRLGYRQEGYQHTHFYGEDFLLFGKVLD